MKEQLVEGGCITCQRMTTEDWYAWSDSTPLVDQLHIVGQIHVPNPGVVPLLAPADPPGTGANTLSVRLFLVQQPGIWPQVMVWREARYDRVLLGNRYERARILCDRDVIEEVEVRSEGG